MASSSSCAAPPKEEEELAAPDDAAVSPITGEEDEDYDPFGKWQTFAEDVEERQKQDPIVVLVLIPFPSSSSLPTLVLWLLLWRVVDVIVLLLWLSLLVSLLLHRWRFSFVALVRPLTLLFFSLHCIIRSSLAAASTAPSCGGTPRPWQAPAPRPG